jgi:hypothetical protein
MYIFYITLLVCVFVLFWQSVYTIIKAYTSNSLNSKNMYIGNIWFFSLVIVNLTIILFIYLFYRHKISNEGRVGIDGPPGLAGEDGELCMFKSQCNSYE